MKSCNVFHHRIHFKRELKPFSQYWVYISLYSDFLFLNCEFILQFWLYFSVLWVYILQFWLFLSIASLSCNSDCISHDWVYISLYSDFLSLNCEFILQFWLYFSVLWSLYLAILTISQYCGVYILQFWLFLSIVSLYLAILTVFLSIVEFISHYIQTFYLSIASLSCNFDYFSVLWVYISQLCYEVRIARW